MSDLGEWLEFAKVAGLGAIISIVLLWLLVKEREQDRSRIETLEMFIRDQLIKQLEIHTTLSNKSLQVISDNQNVTKKVLEVLIIVDQDLKEIKELKRRNIQ